MRNHLDDDDEKILRDGQVLRVPLHAMDHVDDDVQRAIDATRRAMFDQHRPGYRIGDKAAIDAAEKSYRARNLEISNAWRSPARVEADREIAAAPPAKDAALAALGALNAHNAWLRDAWRGA